MAIQPRSQVLSPTLALKGRVGENPGNEADGNPARTILVPRATRLNL